MYVAKSHSELWQHQCDEASFGTYCIDKQELIYTYVYAYWICRYCTLSIRAKQLAGTQHYTVRINQQSHLLPTRILVRGYDVMMYKRARRCTAGTYY